MKLIFFGTPEYVLPVLESLHKKFKTRHETPIAAVVTQKPKPSGRKQKLTYSPVDNWAHKRKVPIFFDPNDLVKNKIEADVGVLAAYGAIIPKQVIDHFPHGIINIHPSLLPEFRGASPVQSAIVTGKDQTGVTFIKLDEQLDHGPIISQFREDLLDTDTTGTLRKRLFKRSAEVIKTLLPAYLEGKITPKKQTDKKATYCTLLKKAHGFVNPKAITEAMKGKELDKKWEIPFVKDFTNHYSPITIHQFIRAMDPWPIAWTFVETDKSNGESSKKRLKILKAHLQSSEQGQEFNVLKLDTVQLEGKNEVSWEQFKQAYPNALI